MQSNLQRLLVSLVLLAGLGGSAAARADGQIFLCVDADGHKELTDNNRKGNCKALELPGLISSPVKGRGGSGGKAAPAATPADFPRVDNAQQKARDNDRREILQDELASEQKKLDGLKAEYQNGTPMRNGNERNYAKYQERVAQMKDNIDRTEKNIDALNRELASIK